MGSAHCRAAINTTRASILARRHAIVPSPVASHATNTATFTAIIRDAQSYATSHVLHVQILAMPDVSILASVHCHALYPATLFLVRSAVKNCSSAATSALLSVASNVPARLTAKSVPLMTPSKRLLTIPSSPNMVIWIWTMTHATCFHVGTYFPSAVLTASCRWKSITRWMIITRCSA